MSRRDLLAQIHIAKKQVGLDDGTYRAVLERVAGRSSAADLERRPVDPGDQGFEGAGLEADLEACGGVGPPTGKLIRGSVEGRQPEKSETSLRSDDPPRPRPGRGRDPDPDMLTVKDASKVIEAIKGIKREPSGDAILFRTG